MSSVQTREAFWYALSREMLLLYGLFLIGYLFLILGAWFSVELAWRGGGAGLIGQLIAALLFLVGFITVLGSLVGFAYKVIADANARALE